MKKILKERFYYELSLAEQSTTIEEKWNHLGRAHILGQFYAWPHLLSHWKMFSLAIKTQNPKEFFGQIPRLILAIPGSLTGKAPLGNTGLSNTGIFTPMSIPKDLEKFLE